MSKRANGEGTIFQRKDGVWVGRISLGNDSEGKRRQRTVYGQRQADVAAKLEVLRQQARKGQDAVASNDSLESYLSRWLADDVAVNKAAKTYEEYESVTRLHVVPFIGHLKMSQLNGEHLQRWQADQKRKGYSDNQRAKSIRILRNALNKAIKLNLISHNPTAAIDKPRVQRREVRPLELDECRSLMRLCSENRLGGVIILGITTGLRLREIFALEWSAVDFGRRELIVRKSLEELTKKTMKATGTKSSNNEKAPKTRQSYRVVTLDDLTLKTLVKRREAAVSEGMSPENCPLVYPDTIGGRLRGSNFNRMCWNPIRDELGIRDSVRFHDLRHTQASLLLAQGVDMKVIQARLGHADFSTTANMYVHLMQGAQAAASDKLSDLFGGELEQ
ncbi:MAG: site-specific integrase [Planctomycetaceae bacterium]|nr:site-specific integrase [Planctomycetaceae bacterium]